MTPLPEPDRERWQPLRAGLVDLFLYDEEEFRFRDGSLLLRGNNGTGKSKVLALLLPFLFDGEVAPHRVEPDGDPKKRMEWNLLLGGRHPHPDRLGYTWIEFGRRGQEGGCEFRTLGCGIKAVAGRGSVTTWFFLTDQRVGEDLHLVGPTRTALGRDRLADALGARGQLFDTASRYRRAVDDALFQLGEERYNALVSLLIQLRQPQLSKRPDEKALSAALTEALPPLDQAVLADAADAFRSLEEERAELAGFVEARTASEAFLGHYRRYAQITARRRAREPRAAQSAYESVARRLADARRTREEAEQAEAATADDHARTAIAAAEVREAETVLRASPQMRDARELELAAQRAAQAGEEVARATTEADYARREAVRLEAREAAARSAADEAKAGVGALADAAVDWAGAAGLLTDHERAVANLATPTSRNPADLDVALQRASSTCRDAAHRRQEAVTHVRGLLDSERHAGDWLREERKRRDSLRSEVDAAAEQAATARERTSAAAENYVAATRRRLDAATELRLPNVEAVLADLADWASDLDGPNPAIMAVSDAARVAAGRLAAEDERIRAARRVEEELADTLQVERARLETGGDLAPPAPHTRDGAARDGRPGAPLWQLVDFGSGSVEGSTGSTGGAGGPEVVAAGVLDDQERAGLEAALEASGLLDAWVTPDGRLLDPSTADTVVVPGQALQHHLGQALRPAVDRADGRATAVGDDAVAGVLAGIGMGAETGGTWVDIDGRFRVGVLEGAWSKPAARYLGHAAREQARRARFAEISAQLAAIAVRAADLDRRRADLDARRATLDAEAGGLPDERLLRAAHADLVRCAEAHRRAQQQLSRAEAGVQTAEETAQAARTSLDEACRTLTLPADAETLAAVRDALACYREVVAGLWPALRRRVEAAARLSDAERDLAAARQLADRRVAERATAERELAASRSRHATLRETVGAAVAELQRRLDEVGQRLRELTGRVERLGEERVRLGGAAGEARGREAELSEQAGTAAAERQTAAERMRRFAATGLLAVALPDLASPDAAGPWAPDPTVRLARQLETELGGVDDGEQSWERVQKLITEQLAVLQDVLGRYGHQSAASMSEDGWVVSVLFRGQQTSPADLAAALAVEVAERERLLDERERTILENHLVSEVASHLQELISDAERQVERMNAELAERPTSTGMRLRFVWRQAPEAPPGLAEARERLLRQVADAWSPVDREAVGAFLQAQIAAVRAADEAGTWLEHLTAGLDYRRWHTFAVQRMQDGQWRSASGPASGGERALAVTIPLFAAASSHYRSASNSSAPRLVLLDEAFAGVDDDARAKCLGLLAEFDLDVVMTSEREWGCYPTVPGLAIAQLSRREGIDAVLVSRWEWDGLRRLRGAEPSRHAAPRDPVGVAGAVGATEEAGAGLGALPAPDGLWS